jgi:hypothetical protein
MAGGGGEFLHSSELKTARGSCIPTLCSSAPLFKVSPDFTVLRNTINWTNEQVKDAPILHGLKYQSV